MSKNAWDTNLCTANPLFLAVNLEASGGQFPSLAPSVITRLTGGAFAVLTHGNTGKLSDNLPVVNGHTGAVLDTDFHPFNDYVIASGSEDTNVFILNSFSDNANISQVMIWTIPTDGLTENLSKPAVTLSGHGRKVYLLYLCIH